MIGLENIKFAITSVRSNMTRAILTLLIIAVGITALVGILTAIDALLFTMNDSFNRIGANSFNISPRGRSISGSHDGRSQKRGENITFQQAMEFKERYDFPAQVSISGSATGNAVVKFGTEKTNPTVRVTGIDENYLDIRGYDIEAGRAFSRTELKTGTQKAIIGMEIVKTLFSDNPEKSLGRIISIGSHRFMVIGVLASKGSAMGQNEDNLIFIPIMTERRIYGYSKKNYSINVSVQATAQMEDGISAAIGVMRNIRGLRAAEENDFEITQSDSLLDTLKENTATIRFATIAIGMITLLGAAIGLMNIMLVSVTERTREIGISKALGATRRNIMVQFLAEAIIICLLGGVVGILLGWIAGNLVAIGVGGEFIIPWAWMALGFFTCLFVGLLSGIYPAMKASRLDPIESLRYE